MASWTRVGSRSSPALVPLGKERSSLALVPRGREKTAFALLPRGREDPPIEKAPKCSLKAEGDARNALAPLPRGGAQGAVLAAKWG